MLRILQLLETDAEYEARCCAARLVDALADPFIVQQRLLGRGGDWRSLAAGARAMRAEHGGDVVHVWGLRGLLAAAVAGVRHIVCTAPAADRRWVRWLRAVQSYRDLQVVCATQTLARAFLRHGLPPERCCVIRPPARFTPGIRRDAALRQRLGFSEDQIVVLAAGESTAAARHVDAIRAVGILHVLDPRWRLLLWGRGDRVDALRRFAVNAGAGDALHIAPAAMRLEFHDLLPAADLLLVCAGEDVPTLPIAMAMAAGVSIVAVAGYTVSELLEDRHTALLVAAGSVPRLAQAMLRLREDGELRWRLNDRARAEAYDYFSHSRFVREYAELYRRIAAGVPMPQPLVHGAR